jgi:hypothetical protein
MLIMAVLAAALAMRAMVPVGWMPAPVGGPFQIVPCTVAALVPATHHHGSAGHQQQKDHHQGDCAFAPLLTAFAPLDVVAEISTPLAVAADQRERLFAAFLATGPPASPPPSTGPPAIA